MQTKSLSAINLPAFETSQVKIRASATSEKIFWTLVGLMCVAVAVSAFFLSKQSLRLDEAQSLWQSSRSPMGLLKVLAQDVHVPLYALVLHFWEFFFGTGVGAVRVLSLLFFLASIPLMYILGRKAFNFSAGLYAAALVAVSPFLNWYGNEIRMYSLMVLLSIINQYFFIKIYNHGQPLERAQLIKAWAGFLISAFLGVYTHYFFWLLLLSQGVFFLIYRKSFPAKTLRNLLLMAGGLIISVLPWLFLVYKTGMVGNSTPLLFKPTSINLFNTFSQFLFGFQDDHLNTLIVSLWPLAMVFAFLSIRKNQKIPPLGIYFLLTAVLPIAIVFLVSIALRPVFLTRYLIFTVPSLYLFLTWFFSAYPVKISSGLKAVLIICMVATLGIQIVNANTPVKENYKQAAGIISSQASPQDIVIITAPFTVYPVEYYYDGPSAMTTLPTWDRFKVGPIPPFDQKKMESDVAQMAATHNRAFVLMSYDQGYEKNIKYYFDAHFRKLESYNLSPGMDLYVYQLQQGQISFDNYQQAIPVAAER